MPKVSVCIPCSKQTQFLDLCLSSVASQDFADYEIIVTDDTPDNTVQDFIRSKYSNLPVRYQRNATSLGTPANWNEAVRLAGGEYIKLLHHDDYFTGPNSLGKFVALLDQNPEASIGFAATEVWNVPSARRWIHRCSAKQLDRIRKEPSFLLFRNMIGAPSATIYRRSELQYDTQLKWLVDIDFYIRQLAKGDVVMTSEPLICTSDNTPGQVTQNVISDRNLQLKEHFIMLEKLGVPESSNFISYFDRLFTRFGIHSLKELEQAISVPEKTRPFSQKVFAQLANGRTRKKLADWFYSSRLNNYIFKAEQF